MTFALPIEILLGIYLGVLTGIIPALVAWTMGFIFKHFTGVSIPALAVVVLSLAIAGANGGLLALMDPTVREAPNSIRLTVAIIVVLMIALYAHAQGDKMGAAFPKRMSLRKLKNRTLSADVIELVGGRGQVRVTIVGEIGDVEGYPPLSPELRGEIRENEWTFPADLPLVELEKRFMEKLRTDYDLAEVSVRLDERARATITAAPPSSGVSKRTPAGQRAVSVHGLVPTGLARGDDVSIITDEYRINGTVLSAQSTVPKAGGTPSPAPKTDGGTKTEEVVKSTRAPTVDGGDGRVTVAVSRSDAETLLGTTRVKIVVRARGKRREYEFLSLLRQAGKRLRKFTVGRSSELSHRSIGESAVLDTHGVAILGVRRSGGWTLAPRGNMTLQSGDELFVVGSREKLNSFRGVIG